VPSPVEVADGLGVGLGVGDGVAECVGEAEADREGEPDPDPEAWGETSAVGEPFFDDPPKPRMTAKATTATTIAV
jgi:hypothetical protein